MYNAGLFFCIFVNIDVAFCHIASSYWCMSMDRRNIFSKQRTDSLWRLASSVLNDAEEAKDVVQDVMLKVWSSPLPIINVNAYLVRAVRNACIDRLRMRRELDDAVPDTVADSVIDRSDAREVVRFAMSRLSDKQRMMVHLKDIEGYSTEEVAKMTGVSESQVRTILSRARKAMRDIIEKESDYEVRVR